MSCRGQVLAVARTERTLRGDATDEAAPTTKEEGRFVRDAGSSEVFGFRGARSALSWRVTGGPHGAVASGGLSMRLEERRCVGEVMSHRCKSDCEASYQCAECARNDVECGGCDQCRHVASARYLTGGGCVMSCSCGWVARCEHPSHLTPPARADRRARPYAAWVAVAPPVRVFRDEWSACFAFDAHCRHPASMTPEADQARAIGVVPCAGCC